MAAWLVKSDADTYSAHDLEREKETVWDGVHNPQALIHIRNMAVGDEVLVYHSGKQKAIVARARVTKGPRANPSDQRKSDIVNLAFVGWLPAPVTLAAIKADPAFAEFDLVRMSRLSVMPVPPPLYKKLMKMAGSRVENSE